MRLLPLPLFLFALLILAPAPAKAQQKERRQYYKGWIYSEEKRYHYREYKYKVNRNDRTYKTQYVIYKPQRTKNYVYWFNPETKKYWAHCATVKHPTLGGQVKKFKDFWGMLPNDKKTDSLDNIDEKDFGADKQESPPIPGCPEKTKIDCVPPDDLPPS